MFVENGGECYVFVGDHSVGVALPMGEFVGVCGSRTSHGVVGEDDLVAFDMGEDQFPVAEIVGNLAALLSSAGNILRIEVEQELPCIEVADLLGPDDDTCLAVVVDVLVGVLPVLKAKWALCMGLSWILP